MKISLLLTLLLTLECVSATHAQTAAEWVETGIAKSRNYDFPGATDAFDKALALDPKLVPALFNRGLACLWTDDANGALGYFDKAIALEPENAQARVERAKIRAAKGDKAAALADYNQAIALQPKYPTAWLGRGNVKRDGGDLSGALKDYDQRILLSPADGAGYYCRALVREVLGNFEGALSDYEKLLALDETTLNANISAHRELILRRLQRADPTDRLKNALMNYKGDDWYRAPGDFITGQLTEAAFLAKAGEGAPSPVMLEIQQGEAFYYVGMMRMLAHDTAGAREYFEKLKSSTHTEADLARAELARLPGAKPAAKSK